MAVVLALTILSGCGSRDEALDATAKSLGEMSAGVKLPEYPKRCRDKMPRVIPKVGEKWRAVQERWEITADNVDKRTADCAAFYGDVKAGMDRAVIPPAVPSP